MLGQAMHCLSHNIARAASAWRSRPTRLSPASRRRRRTTGNRDSSGLSGDKTSFKVPQLLHAKHISMYGLRAKACAVTPPKGITRPYPCQKLRIDDHQGVCCTAQHYTLPLTIMLLRSRFPLNVDYSVIFAASFMATIPTLLVFFWLQRHFQGDVLGGALRE
jgi:hypothetical protein